MRTCTRQGIRRWIRLVTDRDRSVGLRPHRSLNPGQSPEFGLTAFLQFRPHIQILQRPSSEQLGTLPHQSPAPPNHRWAEALLTSSLALDLSYQRSPLFGTLSGADSQVKELRHNGFQGINHPTGASSMSRSCFALSLSFSQFTVGCQGRYPRLGKVLPETFRMIRILSIRDAMAVGGFI